MPKYILPELEKEAFNCPNCGAFSHMTWEVIESKLLSRDAIGVANCYACNQQNIWYVANGKINGLANIFKERPVSNDSPLHKVSPLASQARMIHPEQTNIPLPSDDMPENVKQDYIEAASIYQKSPRASAALLRLATQKIFIELESKHNAVEDPKKKEHLDTIIKSFTDKEILDDTLNKVANSLRLTGNNAVHPGKLELDDLAEITSGLFEFINIIVDELIGKPKRIEAIYNKVTLKK